MKKLICIVCPIGCHLEVDVKDNYKVYGNACPRGEVYGKEELIAPKRVVTSTLKIEGGIHKRVPIKTDGAIPKELVFKCMDLLKNKVITSPVKVGDKVFENIFDTGINIVITRDM